MDDLIQDKRLQCRSKLDQPSIRQYSKQMALGEVFTPITVGVIDGCPYVVDGNHRLEAAKLAGKINILANVTSPMSWEEASAIAATANDLNGVPLKPGDRRKRLKLFIRGRGHIKKNGKRMSYDELVTALRNTIPKSTLHRWIRQDHPRLFRLMSGGPDILAPGVPTAPSSPSPEQEALAAALEGLKACRRHSSAIQDPFYRAALRRSAESLSHHLGGPQPAAWTPEELQEAEPPF